MLERVLLNSLRKQNIQREKTGTFILEGKHHVIQKTTVSITVRVTMRRKNTMTKQQNQEHSVFQEEKQEFKVLTWPPNLRYESYHVSGGLAE